MNRLKSETVKLRAKRTFLKKGTCSRTFFYILDREFGHPLKDEEKAIDLLAGGILQQGYQCGMLWGASMAVGAESYRKNKNQSRAVAVAVMATQNIMKSFVSRTKSIECVDITSCDFTNKKSFAKYMLSGKFLNCYKLAGKWAPEALFTAKEGLSVEYDSSNGQQISCASVVVEKMGGSDEESIMVAGFAGGLGLSGNGCGALAAAVWMNALVHIRKQTGKAPAFNPDEDLALKAFYQETDYEMMCDKICRRRFKTLDEHTDFIKNGGCKRLINVLADTSQPPV